MGAWGNPVPIGFVVGKRFFGIVGMRDRVGTHFQIRLRPLFAFCIVIHPAMWAGSAYLFGKRIWLRSIDYEAIEQWNSNERTTRG